MLASMRIIPIAAMAQLLRTSLAVGACSLLNACSYAPKEAALCACGPDCRCAPCTCPTVSTATETIALFNGQNLDGWRAVYSDGPGDMDRAWRVQDGILQCQGQPIGYMQTTANYESFKLVVEWRFDPAKGAGNSGVLLRVTGRDHVWPRSIESQLQSGSAGDIWNIGNVPMLSTRPECTKGRRTTKAQASNERPLGEWNRYDITLDGGNLSLVVNGIEQNAAINCEVLPGGIALQSEGAYIEFRTVELAPLP